MDVLLVSTYEGARQPLGLARAAAALRRAGHNVTCLDLYVAPPEAEPFQRAQVIGFSVQFHAAACSAALLARDVRSLNPNAKLIFYGTYAALLRRHLLTAGIADAVVGPDFETELPALLARLDGSPPADAESSATTMGSLLPHRSGLPPLSAYALATTGSELRLAGCVEASHGCLRACAHCPLPPVFHGRARPVASEAVLADIDQVVALGARHISFGDADFFNLPAHSLAVAEAMQQRHPGLTFDATINVEYLLRYADLLPRLRDAGCIFITSGFESTEDAVLARLGRGHAGSALERALEVCQRSGIVLHPTWVAFTPWTSPKGYWDMLAFIERHGLVNYTDPEQLASRLLVLPGSPYISSLKADGLLGGFDAHRLCHTWTHPDAEMERLCLEATQIVEDAVARRHGDFAESNETVFRRVKRAAWRVLHGEDGEVSLAEQPWMPVAALVEDRFC